MELPKKLKPSEKYPDENCSVILGQCYDAKTTAEIVRRYDSHDDLLAACKTTKDDMEAGSLEHYKEYVESRIEVTEADILTYDEFVESVKADVE